MTDKTNIGVIIYIPEQNIEWKSETYINLHLFFSCPFTGIKMYTSLPYTMKLASVPGEDSYKAL